MILSGLKKMALERGLTVNDGVAYGSFYGYAATLQEGSGWKGIDISCTFPDGQKMAQLQAALDKHNLKKEYRVLELTLLPDGISIRFHDTIGTLKKMKAFCEWFFPQLENYDVTTAEICPRCGQPHDSTSAWHLIDGRAERLHPSCAERLQQNEDRKAKIDDVENADKSYLSGFIGALIGGLLGAAIWGGVLYMGYVASIVGILIGFFASKGYDLLGGKQKKAKLLIILAVTILSVLAGTMGAYLFEIVRLINVGELAGYLPSDAVWILIVMFEDPAFAQAVKGDILLGLLYGLLGCSVVLLNVHKETKSFKMKQLK